MQARIRQSNQIMSVELLGKVDYETLDGFVELCRKELLGKNIVFNLEGLSFVGSCGVTNFLQVLARLQSSQNTKVKYVGMAKEFAKLFQTMEETKTVLLDVFSSEFEAVKSFIESPVAEPLIALHDLQQKNLES